MIKLVYTSQVYPELFTNLTEESPAIQNIISPSMIDTVTKCVEVASNGQANITFFKIAATDLRRNNFYYRFYFVGANTFFGYVVPFVFHVVINVMTVIVLNKKKTDIRISTYVPREESKIVRRKRNSEASVKNEGSSHASEANSIKNDEEASKHLTLNPSVFGLDSENMHHMESSVSNDGVRKTDDTAVKIEYETEPQPITFVQHSESDKVDHDEIAAKQSPKFDTTIQKPVFQTNPIDQIQSAKEITINSTESHLLNTIISIETSKVETIGHIKPSTEEVAINLTNSSIVDTIECANIETIESSSFECAKVDTMAHIQSPTATVTVVVTLSSAKDVKVSPEVAARESTVQCSNTVQSVEEGLVRHGGAPSGLPFAQEVRLTRISISIICLYLVFILPCKIKISIKHKIHVRYLLIFDSFGASEAVYRNLGYIKSPLWKVLCLL